jgi:hypothetical protein
MRPSGRAALLKTNHANRIYTVDVEPGHFITRIRNLPSGKPLLAWFPIPYETILENFIYMVEDD